MAVLLLLCCFLWPKIFSGPAGIHITVLPVGQGDSSVFEFPGGQVMVIDGGPREDYLFDFLRQKRISKIDILVLSHPDADHMIGFFRVLEAIKVKEIWHSGFDKNHSLMRKFLMLAEKRKIKIKIADELLGEHHLGESKITVLAPMQFDPQSSTNSNSMVIKVSLGTDSALWPGDLGHEREQLASLDWSAKILKAPHHGSKGSSSNYFVKMVSPEHVIFSTQAENNFGFPHQQVRQRWRDAKAKVWDTGTQGRIDVVLTGKEVLIRSFL